MQTSVRTNVVIELAVAMVLILSPFVLVAISSQSKATRSWASALSVVSAVVLILVVMVADLVFGISASWIFTLSVWAVGFGVCLAVRLRCRSVLSLVMASVVTGFMLFLHFADVSPVKPFRRFFAAVQKGMTDEEVMALLHREFPVGGGFPVPVRYDFRPGEIDFGLGPQGSAWSAEGIIIHLENGRVTNKQYDRD
jgi:hypothetical protein